MKIIQGIQFTQYVPASDGQYFTMAYIPNKPEDDQGYLNPALVRIKIHAGNSWIQYSTQKDPDMTPPGWFCLAASSGWWFSPRIESIQFQKMKNNE